MKKMLRDEIVPIIQIIVGPNFNPSSVHRVFLGTNEIFKSNDFRDQKGQSLVPFPKKTRYKGELVTAEMLRSSSLCQSSSE